jgi:hypothetical protein
MACASVGTHALWNPVSAMDAKVQAAYIAWVERNRSNTLSAAMRCIRNPIGIVLNGDKPCILGRNPENSDIVGTVLQPRFIDSISLKSNITNIGHEEIRNSNWFDLVYKELDKGGIKCLSRWHARGMERRYGDSGYLTPRDHNKWVLELLLLQFANHMTFNLIKCNNDPVGRVDKFHNLPRILYEVAPSRIKDKCGIYPRRGKAEYRYVALKINVPLVPDRRHLRAVRSMTDVERVYNREKIKTRINSYHDLGVINYYTVYEQSSITYDGLEYEHIVHNWPVVMLNKMKPLLEPRPWHNDTIPKINNEDTLQFMDSFLPNSNVVDNDIETVKNAVRQVHEDATSSSLNISEGDENKTAVDANESNKTAGVDEE